MTKKVKFNHWYPLQNQFSSKGFNGKAKILFEPEGEGHPPQVVLMSYSTKVAKVVLPQPGFAAHVVPYLDGQGDLSGWSATTTRHIREFEQQAEGLADQLREAED